MASSSSSFSAFNCIAFVLILLLSFDVIQAARPAAVDPMLRVCSRIPHPDTCTECISSESSNSAGYDLRGMIGNILFCAYKNATNALDDAEALANDCSILKNCKNEDIVVKCKSTILDASQRFLASYDVINTKDLSQIQADLFIARAKLNDCAYQQDVADFPQKMINEVETTKRLQEIATSLCQLSG